MLRGAATLRTAFLGTRAGEPFDEAAPAAVRLILILLVVFAAAVRLLRCHEGLPYIHTWDEPYTADTALRIMKTGDLNPHFFTYGSVTVYMHVLVDILHYFTLMGQPAGAGASLTGLGDIKTHYETGWLWGISHPSFYLWDRYAVALIGAVSVALAYALARRFAGPWGALLAAALLAGLTIHVRHSALVAPAVPVTFLVMASALLSVLYIERRRPAYLVFALATAGLAASTKYNAAVCLAMPLLAWASVALPRGPGYRPWLWAAVVLVPAAAFFVGTPYALLDLRSFLMSAGKEVRVYTLLGSVGNPVDRVEPGMEQISLQIGSLAANLGIAGSVLAALGTAVLVSRTAGWVLLTFPIAYLCLMSRTRVPFERNFVPLYPFAAVAFAVGGVLLYRWAILLTEGRRTARKAAVTVFLLLVGGSLAQRLAEAAEYGWSARADPETRTAAMTEVAALARAGGSRKAKIGIAEELHIHGEDLERLGVPHAVRPTFDLICDAGGYSMVVAGRTYGAYHKGNAALAEVMNALPLARRFSTVKTVGREPLSVDVLSENPAVQILEPIPGGDDGSGPCVGAVRPAEMLGERPHPIDAAGMMELLDAGPITSPGFLVAAGTYVFSWRSSGTRARGEYGKLKASVLGSSEGGGAAVLAEKIVELTSGMRDDVLRFAVAGDALVILRLEFLDDFWDEGTGEDRNATIEAVRLLLLAPSGPPVS